MTGTIMDKDSRKLPGEVTSHLRTLAHDLSNSIETILQAAYLLKQAKLEANGGKWVQLIDNAAQDAARINREIREILRSQS
jgi:signal transduction histidine kinase